MELRELGRNGPNVSAIGLGCMGMSDFYGSRATRDDAKSRATIDAAIDAGVTLLDTGDFYGMGHNESLVGDAIRGRRSRVFLSVKFGALRTPSGGFAGIDGRPVAVKNFAAYSLSRLGVDAIDLYQAARVDPAVPIEETTGAIADLIREGKVRHLGLSEVSAEQIRRAHEVHPVSAVQIEYGLATRFIENDILPTCRELGIAIIGYGALSRGLLAGALDAPLEPQDFRSHLPRFSAENRATNAARAMALAGLAREAGATPAQLAIAWVLAQGSDIVPIVGTTSPQRLAENLRATQMRLSDDLRKRLDAEFAPGAVAGERYPAAQSAIVAR